MKWTFWMADSCHSDSVQHSDGIGWKTEIISRLAQPPQYNKTVFVLDWENWTLLSAVHHQTCWQWRGERDGDTVTVIELATCCFDNRVTSAPWVTRVSACTPLSFAHFWDEKKHPTTTTTKIDPSCKFIPSSLFPFTLPPLTNHQPSLPFSNYLFLHLLLKRSSSVGCWCSPFFRRMKLYTPEYCSH